MGKSHGGGFQAIQEYFQQKSCRFCSSPYSSEGIQLLREEPGVLVVRVSCRSCGQPLGVAIVGTAPRFQKDKRNCPADWSKKDIDRLSASPPITYDDVLNAHEFFTNLDGNWMELLPKQRKNPGLAS